MAVWIIGQPIINNMKNRLNILVIEDSENDYLLINRALKKGNIKSSIVRAHQIHEIEFYFKQNLFDVVLSDYNMIDFDGFDVFNIYKKYDLDIPFILVSGTVSDEVAVNFMKLGANDYIFKENLNRLVPAIEREIRESIIRKEHKETQNRLVRNEKKYRQIFESIRDIYYQCDLNGIILDISPSVERYSNFSRQHLIGSNVLEFYYDDSERINLINQIIKKGEVRDFEIKLKSPNSIVYYASVNAHLIYDLENQPYKIEGIIRDISERKNYEVRLETALKKSEESDKLKTAFINNLSHEIRTPLNGIIGFVNLLNSSTITSNDLDEYIYYIKQSSDRLIETISNLILLSEIDTNQFKLNNKNFSLISLISDLYDFHNQKAKSKGIQLDFNSNTNIEKFIINGDEKRYFELLSNFLNNAIKFTDSGNVIFESNVYRHFLVFKIIDTGIGIKKEDIKNIFHRFRQADLSAARGYEGLGIGLSISKGLIEKLEGKIYVKSKLNKGSTFIIKIPNN